jgi:hypothetical protein
VTSLAPVIGTGKRLIRQPSNYKEGTTLLWGALAELGAKMLGVYMCVQLGDKNGVYFWWHFW